MMPEPMPLVEPLTSVNLPASMGGSWGMGGGGCYHRGLNLPARDPQRHARSAIRRPNLPKPERPIPCPPPTIQSCDP
jgi:hypothetical protein